MGHNSWIVRVERIEAAQRAEASAELIADAVASHAAKILVRSSRQ